MIDREWLRTTALGAWRVLGRTVRFLRHVEKRFETDFCFGAAGALSYTTLVSLVPLLVISLGFLSVFPVFDKLRKDAIDSIFQAFVPKVGGTVEQYVSGFVDMAGRTTAIGVVVLAATATLLLATIEDRLNVIWRVHAPRGWVSRVLIYWAVVTLGPLLVGLAYSLSTSLREYGAPFVPGEAELAHSSWLGSLALFVPWLIETIGLTLFYSLIPHCPVGWRPALLGAVIAAAAIEICRWGFGFYLDHFPAYQAIYGALATIPIFLAWMYFTWCCVLFGAEIAAAAPLWGHGEEFFEVYEPAPLSLALDVLRILRRQAADGGAVRMWMIARRVRATGATIAECLDRLTATGFVANTADGGYVLARDLGRATLLELRDAVEPRPPPRSAELEERLKPVRQAELEALSQPIATLVDDLPQPARSEPRSVQGVV
jgi:membrane protein